MLDAVDEAASHSSMASRITLWQQSQNLGLSRHIKSAIDKSLELEEQVVVLEDDIRIGNKFISELDTANRKLNSAQKFATVGGFSGFPIVGNIAKNYWRKSNYFSAWGWMAGRETWAKYQLILPDGDFNDHFSESQSWRYLTSIQQDTWIRRFEKVRTNPELTWDYQMQYMTFKYDLQHLLPLFRICENVGFDDVRSTNTRNKKPKWMQSTVLYERDFSTDDIPEYFNRILGSVDSFTISGDSALRKQINRLRQGVK